MVDSKKSSLVNTPSYSLANLHPGPRKDLYTAPSEFVDFSPPLAQGVLMANVIRPGEIILNCFMYHTKVLPTSAYNHSVAHCLRRGSRICSTSALFLSRMIGSVDGPSGSNSPLPPSTTILRTRGKFKNSWPFMLQFAVPRT